MTYSIRNDRTNEVIVTKLAPAELAAQFAKLAPQGNWLWFHIAKLVKEAESATPEMRDMIGFISDTFVMAVGRGLKNPMIRLGYRETNRRYKLYLSARGTVCLKGGDVIPGTADPVGDEVYIGCFLNGKFLPASEYGTNRPKPVDPRDQTFVNVLSADPVGTFVKCSKDMDRCCYCNLPLEDSRSKERGYGETCANRWGLPWGTKGRTEEFPSFAELWMRAKTDDKTDIRGLCAGIRANPADSLAWAMLRDKLTDAGWPEARLPEMPKSGTRVKVARS